jgi:hypothetical protein
MEVESREGQREGARALTCPSRAHPNDLVSPLGPTSNYLPIAASAGGRRGWGDQAFHEFMWYTQGPNHNSVLSKCR